MDIDTSTTIITQAIMTAQERGTKMCIATVDEGGNLVGFAKMDGAWRGSADIAIKKARASALFNMPSGQLNHEDLHGIEQTNGGIVTFPGGVPCPCGGGAVGVSGDTVAEDHIVAQSGMDKVSD
jgi:uncharacterized protein GlcG (DUF336 family)